MKPATLSSSLVITCGLLTDSLIRSSHRSISSCSLQKSIAIDTSLRLCSMIVRASRVLPIFASRYTISG
uniref:Putative secreted protein n=1 Tax=Anopheles darlingi TaxID=43151 RepID=A0A2M4DNG6_ANODA